MRSAYDGSFPDTRWRASTSSNALSVRYVHQHYRLEIGIGQHVQPLAAKTVPDTWASGRGRLAQPPAPGRLRQRTIQRTAVCLSQDDAGQAARRRHHRIFGQDRPQPL